MSETTVQDDSDSQSDKETYPSVEDMTPIRSRYEVGKNSGKSPDGVNGTVPLGSQYLRTINASEDEEIWLRVRRIDKNEYDDIIIKRKPVSEGRKITIPANNREKLSLSPGDPIKYWIAKIKKESQITNIKADKTPNRQSQTDLEKKNKTLDSKMDIKDSSNGFVWLTTENPKLYHEIHPDRRNETLCGIDYSVSNHEIIDETGPLRKCPTCKTPPSESLQNSELVQSIGEIVGFDADKDTSNWLKRDQLIKIRKYLLEYEEK